MTPVSVEANAELAEKVDEVRALMLACLALFVSCSSHDTKRRSMSNMGWQRIMLSGCASTHAYASQMVTRKSSPDQSGL